MDALGVAPRRLGTAMLAFGLVGLVIAGIVAIGLIGGAFAARSLDDRLEADQARLTVALTDVTDTLGSLSTSLDGMSGTLATSSATLLHASDVLDKLASVSESLAGALDISILGNRPFQGASERIRELAAQIRVFEEDAARLAANLSTNAGDLEDLAANLAKLQGQAAELTERVAAFDRTDEIVGLLVGGILLGGLLVAWIAVAAGACAWFGWRLRRNASMPPAASLGVPGDARPG